MVRAGEGRRGLFLLLSVIMPAAIPTAGLAAEFPLPILDKLPAENRYELKHDGAGSLNEANKGSLALPNGLLLTLSPGSGYFSSGQPPEREINLEEKYLFIENPQGQATLVAGGFGFSAFANTLVLDEAAKRIYIRETTWWKPLQTVREHDLKCSEDECGFFTDKDCLLKLDEVETAAQLEPKLLGSGYEQEENLDKLFQAALMGGKEDVKFFLDEELMGKYFHFDGVLAEMYYIVGRPLLIEYGKKCFKGITLPEK